MSVAILGLGDAIVYNTWSWPSWNLNADGIEGSYMTFNLDLKKNEIVTHKSLYSEVN